MGLTRQKVGAALEKLANLLARKLRILKPQTEEFNFTNNDHFQWEHCNDSGLLFQIFREHLHFALVVNREKHGAGILKWKGLALQQHFFLFVKNSLPHDFKLLSKNRKQV